MNATADPCDIFMERYERMNPQQRDETFSRWPELRGNPDALFSAYKKLQSESYMEADRIADLMIEYSGLRYTEAGPPDFDFDVEYE